MLRGRFDDGGGAEPQRQPTARHAGVGRGRRAPRRDNAAGSAKDAPRPFRCRRRRRRRRRHATVAAAPPPARRRRRRSRTKYLRGYVAPQHATTRPPQRPTTHPIPSGRRTRAAMRSNHHHLLHHAAAAQRGVRGIFRRGECQTVYAVDPFGCRHSRRSFQI